MKKLIVIAAFACVCTTFTQEVYAQDNTQESVKNRLGFFLAVASGDIDEVGIGGIGEFKVAPRVTISPQLLLFFPEDRGNRTESFFELNGNVNYYFYNHDIFEFYGLGGLNYTRLHRDFDDGADEYHSGIGLNLGGGINFEVGRTFVPFSELRVTLGDFEQVVLTGGFKFNLR
jgi:outer membrane immunogenic protein